MLPNRLKKSLNCSFFFFLNWVSLSIPNPGLSGEMEKWNMPFFLLADPLAHLSLDTHRTTASSLSGFQLLGVTLKRRPGILDPPGSGKPMGSGERLLAASPHHPPALCSPLPTSPTHGPFAGGAAARRSLPRAGRSVPCERHQSLALECVWLCRAARDTEPGIMKEILRWLSPPSNQGEAERQACQQYLLLFLPSAAFY